MKIAICIKHVPVSEDVEIDSVTHSVRRIDATCDMNPCDLNAMEMAAQLKKATDGSIDVYTMGPDGAATSLKKCLALGADEAYLLSDRSFAGRDTLGTARVLADFDTRRCGGETISSNGFDGDYGTGRFDGAFADTGSMVHPSGEGNRTKEILGSVSLWMVKNAECPVMLIPPSRDHLHFEKIVFTCDHYGLYDDALAAIKYYSGSPKAQIDIVHVFQKGSEYTDKGIEVLHENKEEHVKEVILFDPEFLESVQAYAKTNEIDLIVMERKDRGFWKELFHISRTRRMAVYSEVPLLVLHDREIKSFAKAD